MTWAVLWKYVLFLKFNFLFLGSEAPNDFYHTKKLMSFSFMGFSITKVSGQERSCGSSMIQLE